MNKIKLGCLSLVLAASLVQAEDTNKWYAGISAGQAKITGVSLESAQSLTDDKDTGYKVYGGYEFNKYLATELYYADLGTIQAQDTSIPATVDADSKSYGITAIASYPVHKNIEPFAKIGFQHWKADMTGRSGTLSITEATDGNDPIYGVGVNFPITESFAFRTEYDVIKMDDVKYKFLSAGLIYKF